MAEPGAPLGRLANRQRGDGYNNIVISTLTIWQVCTKSTALAIRCKWPQGRLVIRGENDKSQLTAGKILLISYILIAGEE
jgi:hypothetical protein